MDKTAPTTNQRRHHGPPLKRASDNPMRETSPAERGDLALLLRAQGMSWSKIATRLGYSGRSAAYTAAMNRAIYRAPASEARRDARRQQLAEQLDELFTGFVVPLLGSDDATKRSVGIEQARQIIERYARLLGVAPSQTPLAERLPQWLEVRP